MIKTATTIAALTLSLLAGVGCSIPADAELKQHPAIVANDLEAYFAPAAVVTPDPAPVARTADQLQAVLDARCEARLRGAAGRHDIAPGHITGTCN